MVSFSRKLISLIDIFAFSKSFYILKKRVVKLFSSMQKKFMLIFLLTLPSATLCCKSAPPPPIPTKLQCPEGYWKVPDGYKCFGPNATDCLEDEECINYEYLCDGEDKMFKFLEASEAILIHNGHEYKDEFKTRK